MNYIFESIDCDARGQSTWHARGWTKMAADDGLLGGYKVGLISASLHTKGQERCKNKDSKTSDLLFANINSQPNFIAVTKKVVTCYYSLLSTVLV